LNIRLERIDCSSFAKHINISDFPFKIGRSKNCHHRIEAKGVWPFHIVLEQDGENGIVVKNESEGSLLINSLKISKSVRLKNGDVLQFGAVGFRFWFAPIEQSYLTSEFNIWFGLVIIIICQVILMGCLL
tara:strand:+ start:414 stop:803 length:390 start_codon:yes stop_codon:yes gene_type:complete